jgi:hypothetical protein
LVLGAEGEQHQVFAPARVLLHPQAVEVDVDPPVPQREVGRDRPRVDDRLRRQVARQGRADEPELVLGVLPRLHPPPPEQVGDHPTRLLAGCGRGHRRRSRLRIGIVHRPERFDHLGGGSQSEHRVVREERRGRGGHFGLSEGDVTSGRPSREG